MFPQCVRKSYLVFYGIYSVLQNPRVFARTEHRTNQSFHCNFGPSLSGTRTDTRQLGEESDVARFPSQTQGDHLPQTLVVCYGPFNQIVLFIPSAWLSHAPNEMTAACDTSFAKPVPYEEL